MPFLNPTTNGFRWRRRGILWLATATVLCGLLATDFCADGLNAAPFVPMRDAHCVAVSPDGRLAAIGISGQSNSEFPPRPHPSPRKAGVIQLFDIATRKRLRRLETFGDLTRIAFSPDGSLLAASRLFTADGGIELNEVNVWEVASGQRRLQFDRCHAFSFAPSRAEIVVVSRKRCVIYDLKSGHKLRQIPDLADAFSVECGMHGETIFGIVRDSGGFRLRSCRSSDGAVVAESLVFAKPFFSLAVSQDSKFLASGHPGGAVVVWNARSLDPNVQLKTGGSGRAFPFYSHTGGLLGAADQSNSDVVVWESGTWNEVGRYTFKQGSLHTFGAKSEQRTVRPEEDPARFAFAPDGEAFLGGPYGGILRLVRGGRDVARFGE